MPTIENVVFLKEIPPQMNYHHFLAFSIFLLAVSSCTNSKTKNSSKITSTNNEVHQTAPPRVNSEQFKKHWYDGKAEITSYNLLQERYGEIRQGTAVTIFVTEDFLPKEHVKATYFSEKNTSVLKLNQMKNFNTGIYPYAIMTSTFNPVSSKAHAIKVSNSVQEWCGQVYMQLNNRSEFEVKSHSYFEGDADQIFNVPKTWLENELWNLIRISPEELPTGDVSVIPSFEYLRLYHKEVKQYNAFASIKQGDSITTYTLNYKDLQRQLIVYFNSVFPYEIEKWEEVNSANQNDTLNLKTTAVKIKRMRRAYWNENKNKHSFLQDSLGLK